MNSDSSHPLARYVDETPGMWFDRLDALHDRHLTNCSDCNYDRSCAACAAVSETGHSCNCSKGGALGGGGYGVLLRTTREEALRLRDGFRQDTHGRVTLERLPNGVLNIEYRAKLLSGRETTVRLAIAAADVGDLCHLVSNDLMEEIDRLTTANAKLQQQLADQIKTLYDLAATAFGVTRDEAKQRIYAASYGAERELVEQPPRGLEEDPG